MPKISKKEHIYPISDYNILNFQKKYTVIFSVTRTELKPIYKMVFILFVYLIIRINDVLTRLTIIKNKLQSILFF